MCIRDSTGAGVTGVTAVGNSSTAQIVFAEDTYTFDTGATTFTATSGDNFDLTKAATTTFTTVGTDITFTTGAIALADGSNLVIDTGSGNGNITLGEIAGTSVETVTLDAGTGTTSVGVIGNSTEIGVLNIGSSDNGAITLNGVITTDGAVTIDGPVTLGANITVTTANDAITFNHTINGTQSLTLESGTAAITLDGVIGGDAILTGLSVNATDGSTGTIEITDIGDSVAVGVNTGTISIGNANTTTLTLDGTTYKTDGVTIYEAAAGNTILLTGASPTITTMNDNLTFDGGNIVLSTAGTTTIDTELGGSGGGNVLIDGAIDGTDSQNEALVINGGSGSVTVNGAIGATNPVTALTIGSAGAGTIELTNIGNTSAGATGAVSIGNLSLIHISEPTRPY